MNIMTTTKQTINTIIFNDLNKLITTLNPFSLLKYFRFLTVKHVLL